MQANGLDERFTQTSQRMRIAVIARKLGTNIWKPVLSLTIHQGTHIHNECLLVTEDDVLNQIISIESLPPPLNLERNLSQHDDPRNCRLLMLFMPSFIYHNQLVHLLWIFFPEWNLICHLFHYIPIVLHPRISHLNPFSYNPRNLRKLT